MLLALIALDKAAGYVLQRWSLVNAQDGYVNGAGYTDVHARLPAELLLVYISVFAAAILLFNIRRQGWTLPVLAVGIWAFVALAIGIIYPALLQALKVTPAQSSLEAPYIQRNITATRAAYGLNDVKVQSFAASSTITASQAVLAGPTIANIRQWDPDPSISLQTFQRLQSIRSYYLFPSLGVDRYTLGGQLTPVLVGVREISSANVPSPSWVNIHLQYTHGNGVAVALANQTNDKNPVFGVQQVPPSSLDGMPEITQPSIYFGLGETGYVVANTRQPEVDYQQDGTNVESHYKGSGGVQLSSILARAAFALRLGDLNLLISSQITDQSRIMFVRDPVAMAEKAAPFLTFDQNPYAVINDTPGPDHGHIDWVVDGYTTSANYAYSQNADSQQVAIGSSLPASYNYVRNSVKVIIDAYSGKMTFYDMDPKDPILQAYSAAFPNMFQPLKNMTAQLQAHLRYPPDIFSIQSAIYGRYHLTNPANFYAASNAWQLSPTAGAGPQSQALVAENTYNNQGQLISTTPARMSPQYQVYALPGSNPNKQVFTVSDGFVPAVAVDARREQPEPEPDGVHGGTVRSVDLRAADPLRGAAGDPGPGERGCRDLGQQRGVLRDHAAEPARLAGAPRGDAHGPRRQRHGVPAAALHGSDDQSATTAGVLRRRARQERGLREDAGRRALGRAADDGDRAHGERLDDNGHGAGGGGQHSPAGSERLQQRAGCAEGE